MAGTAEALVQAPEIISRRTDDILFNVRYLARHILNKELGIFAPEAELDVLEQNITELAEADIHKLAPIVRQEYDAGLGQYVSLGDGTVNNARKGYEALDTKDEAGRFEVYRREEEVIEEEKILLPEIQAAMRTGAVNYMISPSPTHHEADPDAALSFDYDDRTMLRFQWLSADGQTKYMQSFSLFGVPAKAWAHFLSVQGGATVEPTALAVMQHCNRTMPEQSTPGELLQELIQGVLPYVDEDSRQNLLDQLEGFQHEQHELEQQAQYYAAEKLQFQKDLALSLHDWARPSIVQAIGNVYEQLQVTEQARVSQQFYGSKLKVNDYVAELAIKIKTLTTANRAGLATLNERTVLRVASRVGLPAAIEFALREQVIQQSRAGGNDFMVRRNEQLIAESGVGCGGGCSVSVVDLFSSEAKTAREAGLSGALYSSPELDKSSKCDCKKAKVISDGKNVICVKCRSFQVQGKRGKLKQPA